MLGAGVTRLEARVFQPLGMTEGFTCARPHVVVAGSEDDIAVRCLVHATERCAAAAYRSVGARGLDAAAEISGDGDFVNSEAGVGEADLKRLAHAGDFAFAQGCKRADAGVQSSDAVDQGEVCLDRGQVAVAGEGHEAAHRLTNGVEANLVAVGAVLPISRDVDHYDLGI